MNIFKNKLQEKLKSKNDSIIDWLSNNLLYSFILIVITVVIILVLVFSITALIYQKKEILNPNEIGDAIGGMAAPIIGLFSTFLVYIAFRAQIDANKYLQVQNNRDLAYRYLDIIKDIKTEINEIKIDSKVLTSNNTYNSNVNPPLLGVDAIKQIFKLTNPANHVKLELFLDKNYIKIISNYLLAIDTIEELVKLNININEKIFLLKQLYFLNFKCNPIENTQYEKNTFGEIINEQITFINNNIVVAINKFNTKYEYYYNNYLNELGEKL